MSNSAPLAQAVARAAARRTGPVRSNQATSPSNESSPLLLTAEQVADLLGTSKRQIWRLESAGRIPKSVRLGGRVVRWRWTDLVKFVEQLGPVPADFGGRA